MSFKGKHNSIQTCANMQNFLNFSLYASEMFSFFIDYILFIYQIPNLLTDKSGMCKWF